jgi:protoporphyrinogen/coproporphyrinogen III oxidase
VAWIEGQAARYPGLFLAGNAYHGVALNDCTEHAAATAKLVTNFLSTTAAM